MARRGLAFPPSSRSECRLYRERPKPAFPARPGTCRAAAVQGTPPLWHRCGAGRVGQPQRPARSAKTPRRAHGPENPPPTPLGCSRPPRRVWPNHRPGWPTARRARGSRPEFLPEWATVRRARPSRGPAGRLTRPVSSEAAGFSGRSVVGSGSRSPWSPTRRLIGGKYAGSRGRPLPWKTQLCAECRRPPRSYLGATAQERSHSLAHAPVNPWSDGQSEPV